MQYFSSSVWLTSLSMNFVGPSMWLDAGHGFIPFDG